MLAVPFRENLSSYEDVDWLLRANATADFVIGCLDETLAVTHHDAGAARVSKKSDWDQFYLWILESRYLLTPRAFSYCLVRGGISRIRRSRKLRYALVRDLLRLLSAAVFIGKMDLRLCFFFAVDIAMEVNTRIRLRSLHDRMTEKLKGLFMPRSESES